MTLQESHVLFCIATLLEAAPSTPNKAINGVQSTEGSMSVNDTVLRRVLLKQRHGSGGLSENPAETSQPAQEEKEIPATETGLSAILCCISSAHLCSDSSPVACIDQYKKS